MVSNHDRHRRVVPACVVDALERAAEELSARPFGSERPGSSAACLCFRSLGTGELETQRIIDAADALSKRAKQLTMLRDKSRPKGRLTWLVSPASIWTPVFIAWPMRTE